MPGPYLAAWESMLLYLGERFFELYLNASFLLFHQERMRSGDRRHQAPTLGINIRLTISNQKYNTVPVPSTSSSRCSRMVSTEADASAVGMFSFSVSNV